MLQCFRFIASRLPQVLGISLKYFPKCKCYKRRRLRRMHLKFLIACVCVGGGGDVCRLHIGRVWYGCCIVAGEGPLLFIRRMNKPVMVIQAKPIHKYIQLYNYVLTAFLQTVVHICFCSHFLTVNSRRYGRCYVKKIMPLSTFLEFHTRLEAIANSARLFQNAFNKCSRARSR